MDLTRRKNVSAAASAAAAAASLIEKVGDKQTAKEEEKSETRERKNDEKKKEARRKKIENGSSSSLWLSQSCVTFAIVWALLCSGLVLFLEQDRILPRKIFLDARSGLPAKNPVHKMDERAKIIPSLQVGTKCLHPIVRLTQYIFLHIGTTL